MWKFIYLLLAVSIPHCLASYSAADCRELGFIKGQLMCSSCEKLDEFGLDALESHCNECCTADKLASTERRYPKAILEVCTCKFRAYPQIEAFIKSGRPAKFPNLHIKYVRGLDPVVKLLDAKGNVQETLSITKWNTDTVEEFFQTHLERIKDSSSEQTAGGGGKSAYGDGSKQSQSSASDDDDDDDADDFLKTNRI